MEYSADLGFTFAHTPKVMFGCNAVAEVGGVVGELFCSRAVIVTDRILAEKTDLVTRAKKSLGPRLAGVFADVVPDPTNDSVDQGTDYARSVGADCVISLGGGSSIDTAKGMAVTLKEGGKIMDHEGYHALTRHQTPHIAIPTTAGTGSEMTLVTVITHSERGQKTFVGSYYLHPDVAILDPTLTVGMPSQLTAATGMDAMSHAVEALISTLHQPFSDAYALEAIRLISRHLPRCLEKPDDLLARGQMLIAANMGGTAFSNAMVSLNHAMAHSLGARFHIHHGTLNALLLPHTMRYFMDTSALAFAQVAQAMGINTTGMKPEQAGRLAADRMEEFIRQVGLTKRLRDYSVPKEALPDIAEMSMTDGSIMYSPRPVEDTADIVGVLSKAW